MKTLYDFVKAYKDETLDSSTFCDVDALVFSALSYLDIDKIIPLSGEMSFDEVFSLANWKALKKSTWLPGYDKKLIKILLESKRYTNLKISHSLETSKTETISRFYVVRFYIPGDISFVIFRGTDKTFFGCVENLKFALPGEIESISTAREYLKNVIDAGNEKVVIIGHSKGGTIGQYGYIGLPSEYRSKVIKVYNLDGPETKDGIPSDLIDEANEKILKIVTYRSIFGLLLDSNHDYKVVNGKSYGLFHHMVYNWEVNDKELKYVNKPSKRTLKRRDTVAAFLSKRSDEDVSLIIKDVESILHKSNIYYFRDIRLVRLFKAYIQALKLLFNKKRSKEDVKFVFMCMKVFL